MAVCLAMSKYGVHRRWLDRQYMCFHLAIAKKLLTFASPYLLLLPNTGSIPLAAQLKEAKLEVSKEFLLSNQKEIEGSSPDVSPGSEQWLRKSCLQARTPSKVQHSIKYLKPDTTLKFIWKSETYFPAESF